MKRGKGNKIKTAQLTQKNHREEGREVEMGEGSPQQQQEPATWDTRVSPPVGGSGPFLPGSLLCPALCTPSPVGGGHEELKSRAEGGTVPGEGPGVRPCTGSDSQGPPTVPPREGPGEGGWTPEAGGGSSSSIRRETELGEQEDAGVRRQPARCPRPLVSQAPPSQTPTPCRWSLGFLTPHQSEPPGQST